MVCGGPDLFWFSNFLTVPTLEEFASAVIKQNMTDKEVAALNIPVKLLEKLQSF